MKPMCCGICLTGGDLGIPVMGDGVAIAYPGCELHDPHGVCRCDFPDRCDWIGHGVDNDEERE